MRLHCLGTAGYHPSNSRHTSCYFLPEPGIVLDAGTGAFRLEGLIETDTLDVLLSHAHLDHTVGLTYLLGVLARRPVERLRVWGAGETLEAVRRHLFSGPLFPVLLDAQWMALDGQSSVEIGSATLTWRPQQHPGGSLAYRIDWSHPQRSLVYATDTCGDAGEAAAGWMSRVDLLMHECFFADADRGLAEKYGHSWAGRVAEVAEAVQPKQLLLTHVRPEDGADDPAELAAIQRRMPGPVAWAEDHLVVEF